MEGRVRPAVLSGQDEVKQHFRWARASAMLNAEIVNKSRR